MNTKMYVLKVFIISVWLSCANQILIAGDSLGSIKSSFTVLGHAADFGLAGSGLGYLRLFSEEMTPELSQPSALKYENGNSAVEVIKENNVIRQLLAPQRFIDIITKSDYSYVIYVYHASQAFKNGEDALYSVSGEPFMVITIENPDQSYDKYNRLRVTRDNRGRIRVAEYVYVENENKWTLYRGFDVASKMASHGYYERAISWNSEKTIKTERVTIKEGNENGEVLSTKEEVKRKFAFGTKMIKVTKDPDGLNMWEEWGYNDVEGELGYKKLKHFRDYTGYWEKYEYDQSDKTSKKIICYKAGPFDSPENECEVIVYSYDPIVEGDDGSVSSEQVRCEISYIRGLEVSRKYYGYSSNKRTIIECVKPGASYDDLSNLVTVEYQYGSGDYKGKVARKIEPNGKLTVFEYFIENNNLIQTTYEGVPNEGSDSVIDGKKTVVIKDIYGQIISKEIYDIISNELVFKEVAIQRDVYGHIEVLEYLDGSTLEKTFSCCAPEYVKSRNGQRTYYSYDNLSNLIESESEGIVTRHEIDGLGKKVRSTDLLVDGSEIVVAQYRYRQEQLACLIDALGNEIHYMTYVNMDGHKIELTTDVNGGEKYIEYLPDGRIVKVYGSAVDCYRYEYSVNKDEDTGMVYSLKGTYKVSNDGENEILESTHYYDMQNNVIKILYPNGSCEEKTYDENDNVLSKVFLEKDGSVLQLFEYEYDIFDRKILESQKLSDIECAVTRYEYDILDRLTKVTNANGDVEQKKYGVNGKISSTISSAGLISNFFYNTTRKLIRKTQDPEGFAYNTYYSYDDYGRINMTTDHGGGVSIISYDLVGRIQSRRDEISLISEFVYDDLDRVIMIMDAEGGTTEYGYDNSGKIAWEKNSLGVYMTYKYDRKGNLIQTTQDDDNPLVASDDTSAFYQRLSTYINYDEYGRLHSLVKANGVHCVIDYNEMSFADSLTLNPNGAGVELKRVYDSLGRVTQKINPASFSQYTNYNLQGLIEKETDPLGLDVFYSYDRLGNKIESSSLNIDGVQNVEQYAYNKINQQILKIEDSTNLSLSTSRDYDVFGRLLSIKDSSGNTTSYKYNYKNLVIEEEYSDGGKVLKEYDKRGRLIYRTNQNNNTIKYKYNNRDLLIEKEYSGAGLQSFTYDSLGRLTVDTDNNSNNFYVKNTHAYNRLNQEVSLSQELDGLDEKVVVKQYREGLLDTLIYPSGKTIKYSYTELGQVDQLSLLSSGNFIVLVDYDYEYDTPEDGDLRLVVESKKLYASSDVVAKYERDARGQVTALNWLKNDNTLVGFSYQYDLFGNRVADIDSHESGVDKMYSYDSVSRLIAYE
ncbi:MAG: RHS repeat protein, partial [Planctomycetes bacterium]|nr:RHS repeat protein [Planctomycetota bacterium]